MAKLLQFPPVKRDHRIQISALCWRTLAFLAPVYSVWLGLFAYRQLWFVLIVWGLFAIFFLFFVDKQRLEPWTREPRSWPLQKEFQALSGLRRSLLKPDAVQDSVFGTYANDGKGSWGSSSSDEDDGVTIEEYLEEHSQQKKGLPEEAEHLKESKEDSLKTLGRCQEPLARRWRQGIERFWAENWILPWDQVPQGMRQIFFSSLLWLPLLALPVGRGLPVMRYLGMTDSQQITWGSFFLFLLVLNAFFPLLEHRVCSKLRHSWRESGNMSPRHSARFTQLGLLLPEAGSLLAFLLLGYFLGYRFEFSSRFLSPVLLAALAGILLLCGSYCAMRLPDSSLLLFRQLRCLCVSLGFVFFALLS